MKSIMNVEDVGIALKRLDVIKKEEELLFDDLKKINFKLFYDNDSLSDKKSLIDDNFFIMNTIHKNNINYIDEKRNNYIDTSLKVKNIFRGI